MLRPSAEDRRFVVTILLIFFIGLVVLLSIDWTTNPPTFNPLILLFGILVAGVIWMARRFVTAQKVCSACGHPIFLPPDAVFCPYCGARLQ